MRANDAHEHLCLLRQLGGLQTRVSAQMQALACAEAQATARAESAEQACAALQSALVRERARWVLACTRWSWGLGGPPVVPPATPRSATEADPAPGDFGAPFTATDVLCQTGCQGHAHPWLEANGACRLTGADCMRVRANATDRADAL